jgi:cell division protein YceG involved in septum cleavage
MRRLLFFALLLLILAAGFMYVALYQPFQGFPSGGVYVDIPHGASQRSIARMLAENGVVRSRVAFEALCRSRKRRTLEAGEY